MEQIRYLPLTALRESPNNPRKAFDQAALQDLADSLKAIGMQQPMVARPLPEDQQDIYVRYELVFGHRRFRAAQLADPEQEWPCIVREMDDEDVAMAQVAENLQRVDVTALEEADGLQRLHKYLQVPVDRIAQRLGKSRSYVFNRLKLAAAGDDLRHAITDEGLSPEIGVEVARIRSHSLQGKALQQLQRAAPAGDAWPSYRAAKATLQGMFKLSIASAPFDPTDANLAKMAGACTGCSRLAGNDPAYEGVLADDICTDSECWDVKAREHQRQLANKLEAEGKTVLRGEAAMKAMPTKWLAYGYRRTDDIAMLCPKLKVTQVMLPEALQRLADIGVEAPQPVYIVSHATTEVVEAYTQEAEAQLRDLWRAAFLQPPEGAQASNGSGEEEDDDDDDDDHAPELTQAQRAMTDREAVAKLRQAAARAVLAMPRSALDLRVLLRREIDLAGVDALYTEMGKLMGLTAELEAAQQATPQLDTSGWFLGRLETMSPDDMAALLVGSAVCEMVGTLGLYSRTAIKAQAQVDLLQSYGIDVVATAYGQAANDDTAETKAAPVNGDLFGG